MDPKEPFEAGGGSTRPPRRCWRASTGGPSRRVDLRGHGYPRPDRRGTGRGGGLGTVLERSTDAGRTTVVRHVESAVPWCCNRSGGPPETDPLHCPGDAPSTVLLVETCFYAPLKCASTTSIRRGWSSARPQVIRPICAFVRRLTGRPRWRTSVRYAGLLVEWDVETQSDPVGSTVPRSTLPRESRACRVGTGGSSRLSPYGETPPGHRAPTPPAPVRIRRGLRRRTVRRSASEDSATRRSVRVRRLCTRRS